MTSREQEIINLIRLNPSITQSELSEKLSITRSSVAVHITNLMKKGIIKGKRYILSDEPYVCVIGGANVDIQGFPLKALVRHDSNPGAVKISFGGVGRNIAENLARLGVPTRLITAVGNDDYGKSILAQAQGCGLDVKHTLISDEIPTSVYLSILNSDGDMDLAVSQMRIFEKITPDFIKNRSPFIKNARLCVLDTNLEQQTLETIVHEFPDMDFYLDTVSTAKAVKAANILGNLHTIKPNRIEAETMTGIKITDRASMMKAGEYFLEKGVRRIIISMGTEGTYYADGRQAFLFKPPKAHVVNATGAGDAFMAGLVYGSLHDYEPQKLMALSTAASRLTLEHEDTINPDLSVEYLNKVMEEQYNVERLS